MARLISAKIDFKPKKFTKTLCINKRLITRASLVVQKVKNLPAMQETWVQSLGQGRSSGEGNGHPLQYPCLENSMDRGARRATVHGITKSQTAD